MKHAAHWRWVGLLALLMAALLLSHCQSTDNSTDGDAPDGDVTEDGDTLEGDTPDGDLPPDGDTPEDGDLTEGDEESAQDGDLEEEVEGEDEEEADTEPLEFVLTTGSVSPEGEMYSEYGCNPATPVHSNLPSPPLRWSGVPADVKSFVLLMLDLHEDANGWIHWAAINIPAATTQLPENSSKTDMPFGTVELVNTYGYAGYGGPCPPTGTHTYALRLFAMSQLAVNLDSTGKTGPDLEAEIQALSPLDMAEVVFTFENQFGN